MAVSGQLPSGNGNSQRANVLRHFLERLDGSKVSPTRRFVIGALIAAAGVGLDFALAFIWGVQLQALIPLATSIIVGLYVGGWLAIPAAYVGFVAGYLLIEGALLAIMGVTWWEEHAAETPGAGPAYLDFLGLMAEVAIFAAFFALVAGAAALARRAVGKLALRV